MPPKAFEAQFDRYSFFLVWDAVEIRWCKGGRASAQSCLYRNDDVDEEEVEKVKGSINFVCWLLFLGIELN